MNSPNSQPSTLNSQLPPPGWEFARQAAPRLGVAPWTVRNWAHRGLIPCRRVGPGRYQYNLTHFPFLPPPGYQTAKEIAWRLGVPAWKIHYWGRLGLVPVHRVTRRIIYYRISEPPPELTPPPGYETAKELAWRFNVHPSTIWDWGQTGRIKTWRANNRVVYFYAPARPHPLSQRDRRGLSATLKLNEEKVRHIRALLSQGGHGCLKAIAHQFGICPATVRQIRDGRTWRHVL